MADLLLQSALSNVFLALALAAVALIVERTAKRPVLAHLLWVLVLVKLVTPPVVTVPVVTLSGPSDRAVVAGGQSQQGLAATADHELAADGRQEAAAAQSSGSSNDAYLSAAARSSLLAQGKAGLSLIWLLGSALVFGWSLVRIYRFTRLLGVESEAAPHEVQAVAAGLANRLGLKAVPTVYTTSAHLSPMVWWVGGRLRIVIPAALLDQMERRQFQWILAHELAHVRRRDYLVRWLEWLACVCFWWNPLVWLARHHLRANEELCCDALVVSSLKPTPHIYANSLLAAVEYLVCSSLRPPVVASEINSGGFFERRFKMIVSGQPKRRTPRWLQVCVLLCAAVVLPLGLVYGQDVSEGAEAYLQAVAERLQAEVEAGDMTAEQAEAKLAAIEKEAAVKAKTNVYFEEVWAKLQAEVKAGKMTAEDAEAKMAAIKKEAGIDGRYEDKDEDYYAAMGKRLRAAVAAGEITEEEAKARWEEFEKRAAAKEKDEEYETVGLRLRAAVAAGKMTAEDARARYREIWEQMSARGSERSDSDDIWRMAIDEYRMAMDEYRMAIADWRMAMGGRRGDEIAEHEAVGLRLRAAVAAGEITEEEAKARWEEFEKRAAAKEKDEEYETVGLRLRAAVEAGEMTEEEAKARWDTFEKQAAAEEDWEAIGRRIRAAVEAGELTEEQARAKWEDYKKQVAAEEEWEELGLKLRAAVEAGEMTEEEAKAKWEEYEQQEAAEEK